MIYADYNYYTDIYGGTIISEDEFSRLIKQASLYIDAATMNRAEHAQGKQLDAIKDAACALAEVFLSESRMFASFGADNETLATEKAESEVFASQTVGDWVKTYRTITLDDINLIEKRKLDTLYLYLNGTGLLAPRGWKVEPCSHIR